MWGTSSCDILSKDCENDAPYFFSWGVCVCVCVCVPYVQPNHAKAQTLVYCWVFILVQSTGQVPIYDMYKYVYLYIYYIYIMYIYMLYIYIYVIYIYM